MKRSIAFTMLWVLPFAAHAEAFKARLEWAHTVELRFIESGVVSEVPVLAGQAVEQGQALAKLDARDFDFEVTEAMARVRKTEAALNRAERRLEWTAELYDRGLIADNERLESEEDAAAASADHELAQTALAKAKLAAERSVLKAPFQGVVAVLDTWPGQVILKELQADPPVLIADGRRMVARARLTAERIREFKPGDPLEVRVEGGQWRKAEVYRMGVESEDIIDRGAVYGMDAVFEVAPGESLRPGQVAVVRTVKRR